MKRVTRQTKINQYALLAVVFMVTLLPFNAFFTTWLGANLGHIDLFVVWKEILILILLPIVTLVSAKDKQVTSWLKNDWLPRLILVYLLIHILSGAVALNRGQVNLEAWAYAIIINLRFLGLFLLICVIQKTSPLKHSWLKPIMFIPALIVIAFGLAQILVLPHNFLEHFGYAADTIPAVHTVDQKIEYQRVQSTLRGPNPLGAYLALVIPLAIVLISKKFWKLVFLMSGTAVLYLTYSRSAWIGFILSFVCFGYFWRDSIKSYRNYLLAGSILVVILIALVSGIINTNAGENILLHTDDTSTVISSNESRLRNLESGLSDVVNEPLGRGPGTAGPASNRNKRPSRTAENYYIQIAQEIGIAGVLVFLAINTLVIAKLWDIRDSSPLAKALMATWLGIVVINLVSHAWTDEVLSYLWWVLAAVVLSPAILNKERKS